MIIRRHGRVRLRRTLLALFAALLLIASLSWLPHARAEQPPAPFEPVVASEGATAEERTEKGQEETKNPSEEPRKTLEGKTGQTAESTKEQEGKKKPPDEDDKAKTPATDDEKKDKEKNGDKDKDKEKDEDKDKQTWYSVHGQGTVISQGNWKFRSPYEGPNSFRSILNYRTSETATLFLAARIWEGGAIVFNPEVSGGRGLSDVFGLGGFPNG